MIIEMKTENCLARGEVLDRNGKCMCIQRGGELDVEIVCSASDEESGRASTSSSVAATAGLLLRNSIQCTKSVKCGLCITRSFYDPSFA